MGYWPTSSGTSTTTATTIITRPATTATAAAAAAAAAATTTTTTIYYYLLLLLLLLPVKFLFHLNIAANSFDVFIITSKATTIPGHQAPHRIKYDSSNWFHITWPIYIYA